MNDVNQHIERLVQSQVDGRREGMTVFFNLQYGWEPNWSWNTELTAFVLLGKRCMIWLEKRPDYCDRGNWLAHIAPREDDHSRLLWRALSIEANDYWPRYYMKLSNLKDELEEWFKKRGEWL